MANNKTVNLLPEVFRTDTNKKFLNATLDQLVSDSNFQKINGYIGRRFSPTAKSTDYYIKESSALRQNYQLEPSAVIKNKSGNIEFFGNYIDLLQQIEYYGGNIADHDRLFKSKSYSYNGLFDFDKFVNFNQYYWLPNGPATVTVSSAGAATEGNIIVTRDTVSGSYKFSTEDGASNPELFLVYGGTYNFVVNQPGIPFWIQTEPGTSGLRLGQPNTSSRQILGVTNNGEDVGTVTFTVPMPDAQDSYNSLNLAYEVDIAVDIPYNQVQGLTVAEIVANGGLDGATTNFSTKRIIFVGQSYSNADWTPVDVFDAEPVPVQDRYTVWTINLIDDGNGGQVVDLVNPLPITNTQKVFVLGGVSYANTQYLIASSKWSRIPPITAAAPYLYYQDNLASTMTGSIRLINAIGTLINVDTEILGKTYFKSPSGVTFTNGLKIQFDSSVTPTSYANKLFYVEGVGTSIKLVSVEQTDSVGQYITDPTTHDYITINRASVDRNAWSRTNRWFHIDVITATATYLDQLPSVTQAQRALRPIIEFEPDLQLFNQGSVAKDQVDILDLIKITNAFLQVENHSTNNNQCADITVSGTTFRFNVGDRIIFAADTDPLVKNKIYVVSIFNLTNDPITPDYRVHLELAQDSAIAVNETMWTSKIYTVNGLVTDEEYWFDGATWSKAQQKTAYNQSPLFDIFTSNNVSLSHRGDSSTFVGTRILSYKLGSGRTDQVLGFPLSYRNFQNVGDIEFSNDFDADTYQYLINKVPVVEPVNNYFIRKNTVNGGYVFRNVWTENKEPTKQYQIFNYTFTGETNYFVVDVAPESANGSANLIVYRNNGKILDTVDTTDYSVVTVNGKQAVRVNINILTVGDGITIKIYSNTVSTIGAYEIPKNLDLNSLNSTFASLTLGQIRNHLVTLTHNTNQVVGVVPGVSNLRDLSIKDSTGSILQHQSPAIYSNLFLLDRDVNFIKSAEYAQKEYTKFKNKFLELSLTSGLVDTNDIPSSVDAIVGEINRYKNSKFAWYYSDMVPYGNNIQPLTTYQILDAAIRQYEITTIFDDTQLSDRAVLVYYATTKKDTYGNLVLDNNNAPIIVSKRALVKGRDYYFNQDRPAVTLTNQVAQLYNDLIIVKDYISTNGSYVPETPTKLGLYPKFVPSIFTDDTYLTPTTVVQGHDGSLTPTFGDYRDQMLLELETRIYNNIKVTYDSTLIDIYNYLPGRFRDTDYNLNEFNTILTTSFLKWIGSNRVNYTNNNSYNSNEPFSWSYKNFYDVIDGRQLPGSWRAIFKYYYDTDRPHQAPWEMLGFSGKPTWWENRYGPAPYTGGNLVLWTDLSLGYIYGEDRYDIRFARPDLLRIIPVDDAGNLRSPDKFLVANFSSIKTNSSFAVGDIGPAENAWRRSSDYSFALQQILALMNPGFYFGTLMNVDNYNINPYLNQVALSDTLQRITPTSIKINGLVNGSRQRTVGYINWIGDYLTSLGINPGVKIINYLSSLNVQLSYKLAGFTGKNYIKVLAEQSSPTSTNQSIVIPDNNYEIFLNKSTPVKKINYSAVIVQRSGNGWTISGYDIENPFFTIIPSLANNNAARVEVGSTVAVIYQDFQNYKIRIPYGYEFNTRQQVVDFLISYGRYLIGQGMRFDAYSDLLNTTQDWTLSAREFLTWSQQGWRSGSLLVLSPIIDQIVIENATGTVDYIENNIYGSKLLDQDNNIIKNSQFTVVRYGNQFKLNAHGGQTIGFAQLNVVQYEHALIFDNATLFNDIIYKPELGNRQFRLKLVGNRTGAWNGQLDIPGFVYNNGVIDEWTANTDYRKGSLVTHKNNYYVALTNLIGTTEFLSSQWKQIAENQIKTGLLNNLSYSAQEFDNLYDINNQPQNLQLNKFSNGLIGFRERSYLTDLGLDIETQAKFYQGYIKQKGTRNAVDAFNQVSLNNVQSSIETFEEWAVRVGEYGATDSNDFVEIVLDEQVFTSDPETLVLLNTGGTVPDQIVGITPENLWHRPNYYNPNLLTDQTVPKDISIPITAGYVNLADVDATLFDIREYTILNNILYNIGAGYKIWVAKDFAGDWNVYRVNETDNFVIEMSYALNGLALVTTYGSHNFDIGDVVAIRNFDTDFDGFYRVFDLDTSNTFYVVAARNAATLQKLSAVSGSGLLFQLESMRVDNSSGIISKEPLDKWRANDIVWADNDQGEGRWSVYEKFDVWSSNAIAVLSSEEYVRDSLYGTAVKISRNGGTLLAGQPSGVSATDADVVRTFSIDQNTNQFLESDPIKALVKLSTVGSNLKFGTSIDSGTNVLAIGAPGSLTNQGLVFLYNYNSGLSSNFAQILRAPDGAADDLFGQSISMSKDDRWIYVGAPGANKVYVYGVTTPTTRIYSVNIKDYINLTLDPDTGIYVAPVEFTLSFTPVSIDTLVVTGDNHTYVANVDFTLAGNIVTFVEPVNDIVITFKQARAYKLIATLTPPAVSGVTYNAWGSSIKTTTDGKEIVIGDPRATVNGTLLAGVSTVHQRIVESFIGDGTRNTFTPRRSLPTPYEDLIVTVDGVEQTFVGNYFVNGNSVQFVQAPTRGSVVQVEINQFGLVKVLGLDNIDNQARFGYAVDICNLNCSVYVGAPYYTRPEYYAGRVYRYVNQGRVYGTITGTAVDPTLTLGNSIFINGIEVLFTGTTVASVATDINAAHIPGITALVVDGQLIINSTVTVANKRLDILPGVGADPLADLGLEVYAFTQAIEHPNTDNTQRFGTTVKVSDTANTLFVGSSGATATELQTMDQGDTTLDQDSTRLLNVTPSSGAVFVFDYVATKPDNVVTPGQFVSVEEIVSDYAQPGANFGASIDAVNGMLVIGADRDSRMVLDAGEVYSYINDGNKPSWQLIRQHNAKVDTANLNRMFVYNKKTNEIQTNLDIIDPAKGKILGIAEQELDYITSYDPAKYNQSNPVIDTFQPQTAEDSARTPFTFNYVGTTAAWGAKQVGQLWWNLDACRYIDYEQDTLVYRSKNWGKLFPGSTIEVCEWVESSTPPASYTGSGTPKFNDNSTYSLSYNVDGATGVIVNKYYFWVVNKNTSDPFAANKTKTAADVANIIENPQNAGVSYAAAIRKDAFNLYNINHYISDTDAILQIAYSIVPNENIIHSEYELIKENTVASAIPAKIINKIVDSLVGETVDHRLVPNPKLPHNQQTGIESRPMQSVFKNRFAALQTFVDYCNQVMIQHPVALEFDTQKFYTNDAYPEANSGAWNLKTSNYEDIDYIDKTALPIGYKILVTEDTQYDGLWTIYELGSDRKFVLKRVQTYRTDQYIDLVDWYDSTFNVSQETNWIVQTLSELETIRPQLIADDIVLVNNDGSGRYAYYRANVDKSTTLVGLQNGTIQISAALYDPTVNNTAFGSGDFDTNRFDEHPVEEIRNIFAAIQSDIFVKYLDAEFNKLFFVLVNYLLSEQKSTDWIFKTSFISVLHKIRKLDQYPSYIRDNQTYYQEYINEVKPYRTQIREYVLDYTGDDLFGGNITDFDLPSRYDSSTKIYHSPTVSNIEDPDFMASLPTALRAEYSNWYNNYKYRVSSIELYDAGGAYVTAPNVTITGGGGTGARATANIWTGNGTVRSVTVTNPGTGYITRPNVTIEGNARAIARMHSVYYKIDTANSYNTVRSISSTIKFDRINYTSNIVDWRPNTVYYLGDTVRYDGDNDSDKVYRANVSSVPASTIFDYTQYVKVAANEFDNANDRTIGYYTPGTGMPARDLEQLYTGIGYPGVKVSGIEYDQKVSVTSDVIQFFAGNSTIYSKDIGKFNFNKADLAASQTVKVTGSSLNNNTWTISVVQDDRAVVFSADVGIVVKDEPAGAPITLTYYNENNPLDMDSIIQSSYLDTALGTRPEDIDITGGAYVDRYSSHAPEELIPGRLYDNLNIEVWTQMYSGTANVGYRIYHGMNNDSSTQLMLELSDTITVANVYPEPTYISQVYLDHVNPLANTAVAFGPGVQSITSDRIPVYDYYEHGIDRLGFVVADDRSIYVNDVDQEVTVVGVRKNSWPEYYTISPANITVLTSNLNITDTTIRVADASVLPPPGIEALLPGVVFINGEKITYYGRNLATNTLSQIRRGVDGTGARLVHVAGSRVVDSSEPQRLTTNSHLTTWINAPTSNVSVPLVDKFHRSIVSNSGANITTTVTQTLAGLENSSTPEALAIRLAAGLLG
jgi:hypothetical protein